MLTHEQRHLLAGVGARPLTNVLLEFDIGLQQIKNSQAGGQLRQHDGAPEWLTTFDTTSKGFIGRESFRGDAQVTVTWTQLRHWADDVPAGVKDQLRQVRLESRAEANRVYKWCYCDHGDPVVAKRCEESNVGDPFWGGRRHPSEDEYLDHLVIDREIDDREKQLILQALGLIGEPVVQLDLFGNLMEVG